MERSSISTAVVTVSGAGVSSEEAVEAVEAVDAQEEVKAGAVKAVASGWGPRGPRVAERAQSRAPLRRPGPGSVRKASTTRPLGGLSTPHP